MKKIILLLFVPLSIFSQATDNEIFWNSNFHFESNSIKRNIISNLSDDNTITNQMIDNWLNSSTSEYNIIHSEILNSLDYKFFVKKMHFGLSISDNNILNTKFTDDLIKLAFKGNYFYQDQQLDFGGSNFRASRFQQYKFIFGKKFNNYIISSGISYLSGNHHLSYIINEGTLFTAQYGSHLDILYNMNAFVTDTSDFTLFANNGNGFAFDFSAEFKIQKSNILFSISDLGFINWNKSSVLLDADSTFNFSGILINDIFNFNDSILENTFITDLPNTKNNTFKSYIPATVNLTVNSTSKYKYFKNYSFGIIAKWYPYMDDTPLSFLKINQGFKQSNFKNLYFINSIIKTKYCDLIPKLSHGGYSKDTNLGLALAKGKKNKLILGTYNLLDLINNNDANSLSIYINLTKHF